MDSPQDPNKRTTLGKRNNIAIGSGAVAGGGRNISIGENAGQNTTDNWNIHNVNVGSQAGEASKKDYSVAVGYHAGAILSDAAKKLKHLSQMATVLQAFISVKKRVQIQQLMVVSVLAH